MNHKEILEEDLASIASLSIDFLASLANKTILVTGATGLIGFSLIKALLHINQKHSLNINVLALVRNFKKAESLFGKQDECLKFIVSDISQKISIADSINYIVHGASQTASKAFVQEPVETICTAFNGTTNMLKLAKEKKVSSFVYLSSMEVYGTPATDEKIPETHPTDLDTMSVRSCYPESKRICESLCKSYFSEYSVPTKIIRLTQTFGPGVSYNDGRVFAEFARCAIENRDIVLHTKGETKRNYLYTADAVTAILTVLLKGKNGEAYNAANENTYTSIYEMANIVATHCANGKIKAIVQEEDIAKFGYASVLKMNLDTSKLQNLGWKPTRSLIEMFERLIKTISET